MRGIRGTVVQLLYMSIVIAVSHVGLCAQNTILVGDLHNVDSTFVWDTTVFATRLPSFALGHQWGAADLDKLNTALQMNVTADQFGYLDANAHIRQLKHLGRGNGDTNYLVWTSPLANLPDSNMAFFDYWMGMRWEPAENGGYDRSWKPRDADAWPLSFTARHYGTVSSVTSDVNYRRYKLDPDTALTYPVKVLDSAEPRNRLYVTTPIDWLAPLETEFPPTDSADCRRLQLVINLRRTSSLDDIKDTAAVVSVVVPYQLRWKDHVDTNKTVDSNRYRMSFRTVPDASVGAFQLPNGRGTEMHVRNVGAAEFVDSIVIRRDMLPLHSDSTGPDISIVAEFRTDSIRDTITVLGALSVIRRPHILKHEPFDFPRQNADTLTLADTNRRYMAIDTLGVTVWYHGNSSVAIRSISLVTPQTKLATSGYRDAHWASKMKDHVASMKNELDNYHDSTGRTFKVLSFYMCDEFRIEHLLGMRYRLQLLDRRLTSETGFGGPLFTGDNEHGEYGHQKLQGFPTKFLWMAGMSQPGFQNAAPYFAYGKEGDVQTNTPMPTPSMGLKNGYIRDAVVTNPLLSEAMVKTNYARSGYGTYGLPLDSAYRTGVAYQEFINSDRGPAAWFENIAFVMMYQTGDMFFAKRRDWWANFFYHMTPTFNVDSSGRPYFRHTDKVPQTGEWVRLEHGASLAMGCRGFMYDKWRYGYPVPPSMDSLDALFFAGKQIFPSDDPAIIDSTHRPSSKSYMPGFVCDDSVARAWDTDSTVTADSLVNSGHLGSDYLTDDDPYRIQSYNDLATMASFMGIARCIPGADSQHVYIGRRSMLAESKWWHDLVTDTQTVYPHSIDRSNAYYFMRTRPVGWFGKGYRTLMNGDTNRLRHWVEAYEDSVHVYRWERTSPSDTTLVLREEPTEENLYDMVLMDTVETGATDTFCILAITNRRTLPWLYNAHLGDSIEFMASYDFDTLTRHSRPDLRYRQVGARRIEIPFKYSVDLNTPYLFNIRDMVPRQDSAWAIDTVVSSQKHFTIDLRPGETRFLRIKCIRAADSIASGYLAYSTQNKLIAFPVAKSDSSGYTDSIRYHMTYHARELKDSTRLNVWTVYYKRSRLYHRDSLPQVDGIAWEPSIALSKQTYLSTFPTDASFGTRYNFATDSAGYLASLVTPAVALKDCSCGFPSIVVREVQSNVPKVFVVYACEDMWTSTTARNNYFHVVENAFLDRPSPDTAYLGSNGRSLVVCRKDMNHDGGSDTLKSLARYGTPVINASGSNTMYYAWSSSNTGISAGKKSSTQTWFPNQGSRTTIPSPSILSGSDTLVGGTARFPSLNVYSNIAQQRTDATLVWQEGSTHPHIRYTRLTPGTGSAITRSLPTFVEMSYDSSSPPSIPRDTLNRIAVVGGKESGTRAELPVVVRSLQSDTMGLFIRDADGSPSGSMSYNHETVAWSEYITSQGRSRIRYNHFIDRTDTVPSQLHYWWTNTTYGSSVSLFHPVLTSGIVRIDSLTWEGIVDDSLVTYDDSLHIIRGDVSDSSLVVNYCVLDSTVYDTLRNHRDSGHASYWTGQAQFSTITTQQIFLRRTPRPPSSSGLILHYDYLTAGGAWPHLAMRMRENLPVGIRPVRRIMQYTNDAPPHLYVSAEGFYKTTAEETPSTPVTRSGYQQRDENVTVRAVLEDGTQISFHVLTDTTLQSGYSGSTAMAMQQHALVASPSTLVSDAFFVDDISEIDIISGGQLRDGIHLSIEDCDSTAPMSAQLDLAAADESAPDNEVHQKYYVTNGNNRSYRLRLINTGLDAMVYREDRDIDPPAVTFAREVHGTSRCVDLNSMRSVSLANQSVLSVFPNPSHDVVSVIVDGVLLQGRSVKSERLRLTVVDAVGTIRMSAFVRRGEIVELTGLPSGVYYAAVWSEEGSRPVQISHGQFSVLR